MQLKMFESPFEATIAEFLVIFLLLAIISMVLKAISLWKSARAGKKWWFVALMFINTMGLLPIIYLIMYPEKPRTRASKASMVQGKEMEKKK